MFKLTLKRCYLAKRCFPAEPLFFLPLRVSWGRMCHFVYRVVLYFSLCCETLLGFPVGLFLLKLNFIASNLISLKGLINIKVAVFSLK